MDGAVEVCRDRGARHTLLGKRESSVRRQEEQIIIVFATILIDIRYGKCNMGDAPSFLGELLSGPGL